MPIRCPAGALPAAHRVICLRSVRALSRGCTVAYSFSSIGSKKCIYCTEKKEPCEPVPDYVGEEFTALKETLKAWEGVEDGDDDQEALLAEVTAAARKLSLCVQVTRSQEKEVGMQELLMANHTVLARLLEEVTSLKILLASHEPKVGRLSRGGGGGKSG